MGVIGWRRVVGGRLVGDDWSAMGGWRVIRRSWAACGDGRRGDWLAVSVGGVGRQWMVAAVGGWGVGEGMVV